MRNLRNNKGFTLIELMIVVVIIGILAAIAIPKFSQVSVSAKQAEAQPILKQICALAEAEQMRTNVWPTAIADIDGWQAPSAKYFTFTFAGGTQLATATAVSGSGVTNATLNCVTGVATP